MNLKPVLMSVSLAIVLLYAGAYLGEYLSHKVLPGIVWGLIPIYGVLTVLLFRMISASVQKNPTRFVTSVYASVLIKLMLSVMIVGVYFYIQYPARKAFTIAIMGIYAVFTFVLIRSLLPLVRSNGNEPVVQK